VTNLLSCALIAYLLTYFLTRAHYTTLISIRRDAVTVRYFQPSTLRQSLYDALMKGAKYVFENVNVTQYDVQIFNVLSEAVE